MVNRVVTSKDAMTPPTVRIAENPEVALALSYAPLEARDGLKALVALDDALAAVLRGAGGEPMLVQMRLVWWRDALIALDTAPPPAVPVLEQAARDLVHHGVTGGHLAAMVEGWLVILDDPVLEEAALGRFAAARGGIWFAAAATRLALGDALPLAEAGRGWALADLARHVTDRAIAERAVRLARPLLDRAVAERWPSHGRALGALARLAWMDVRMPLDRPIAHGAPGRVARLAWHRMTGR